ncbi:MAG: CDP-alcohol phosphatidyltransferase family protein [Hyphomonadaceae bacterium]
MNGTRPARLPMALTLARLLAGPLIAWLILWAHDAVFQAGAIVAIRLYGAATLLFILAALTDWLDGALARRLGAVTPFGAALDHIADKTLTASALIALAYAALPPDLVIAALALVVRDLAVAGLREAFSARLPVDRFGKLKAAAAMAGVAAFLAFQTWGMLTGGDVIADALLWLARALLWLAAILALWSGARYVRAAMAPTV